VFPPELSVLLDGCDGSIELPSRCDMDHSPARQRQPGRCGKRTQSPKKRWVRARALIPGRTDSRIRSPRLTASSRWKNVDEGSRQNGCVTSEEALAPGAASLRLAWLCGVKGFASMGDGLRGLLSVAAFPFQIPTRGTLNGEEQSTWNYRCMGVSNCLIET
jgi:hypothetical protein